MAISTKRLGRTEVRSKELLRDYQVRGARFVLNKRFCALFIDMGLGKTAIVLTALARLLRARKIDNVLLIAPLRVVQTVWREEAKLWNHTRAIKFSLVHGTPLQRIRALNKPAHVYLVNVDNVAWLDEVFGKRKALPFDMLVVDESSMFKAVKTTRFRVMRRRARDFKRRVIMTGTPTPNGLYEVWPQMYLVDRGYSLGQNYGDFKEEYFRKGGFMGKKLVANEGSMERVIEATSRSVMRLDAEDWINLPKLIDVPIRIELPAVARQVYEQLETEMFIEFESTGTFIDNEHAAALRNRCCQITGGAVYATHGETDTKVWQPIHTAKIDAIREIVEELQGEPPIIVYRFRHEMERLLKAFPKFKFIGSGTKDVERIVEHWNARKLPGLIVHPASVGHGLNLQHGGRHFIWMSLTESLELYLQLLKRLHRSGQEKSVINYWITANDTVDEVVETDIATKDERQRRVNASYRDSTFRMYMDRKLARKRGDIDDDFI